MGAGKQLETEQSGICLGFGKGNWWVGEWQSEETGVCQHEIRNELSGCLLLGGNNKTEMLGAASRQLGAVKSKTRGRGVGHVAAESPRPADQGKDAEKGQAPALTPESLPTSAP